MLTISECSSVGSLVLKEKGSIIVGISINNSYFKEPNLEKILSWSQCNASKVYIMIPDEPSIHTLIAIGYAHKKAENITRLKSNALENKCLKIIQGLNSSVFNVLRWKSIVGSLAYLESLCEMNNLYCTDVNFRKALRDTTAEVVSKYIQHAPTEIEIDNAVVFLIKELSFICNSNNILDSSNVAYLYQNTMNVLRDIVYGKYSFKTSVGFITAIVKEP